MRQVPIIAFVFVLIAGGNLLAQTIDEVTTKDGSVIRGEIVNMTGGKLTMNPLFGEEVIIQWADVVKIKTSKPLPFVMQDPEGRTSTLTGLADEGEEGTAQIKSSLLAAPATVKLESVTAINPPAVKPVTYKGNINVGFNNSDGNTQERSAVINGEFRARSKRHRLTLGGQYNYKEDEGEVSSRNGRAGIQYDFFVRDRLYFFTSAFFENDKFQDLDLRTALSFGPGYQLVDNGDFEQEWLKELEVSIDAGISFFDENYKGGDDDDQYTAGRWGLRIDWPVVPSKVTLFHRHNGYPGLEDLKDLYVVSQQGIRFNVFEGLVTTFQIDWRWDNTPASGRERADTLYMLTLGYDFEL